jgi:hypothetical protein
VGGRLPADRTIRYTQPDMSTLDSNHRLILEHELAEVDEGIAKLMAARSYLRGRLGLSDAEREGPSTPANSGVVPAGADLKSIVNPGQYGGMSGVKAARALLEKVGRERPLTTREIYDAITYGGVTLKGTDVLTKVMKRSGRFHRPVPGRWGLAEWYPASVRARGAADNDLSPDEDEDDGDLDLSSETEGETLL